MELYGFPQNQLDPKTLLLGTVGSLLWFFMTQSLQACIDSLWSWCGRRIIGLCKYPTETLSLCLERSFRERTLRLGLCSDGAGGKSIQCRYSIDKNQKNEISFRCKGMVFSAGILGTLPLLMKLRKIGTLPTLSPKLRHLTRTNSKSMIGVLLDDASEDLSKGVAIRSVFRLNEKPTLKVLVIQKGRILCVWMQLWLLSVLQGGRKLAPGSRKLSFTALDF